MRSGPDAAASAGVLREPALRTVGGERAQRLPRAYERLTAERAEIAKQAFLCVLCGVCGSRLSASGEAAKWEQDLAELRKNLPQGPQKGPQADRIVRQREAGKSVTPPTMNRLGA